MKARVPPDAEAEGATASPTLCLLKTRLVQVSSSPDSIATTPACLSIAGAGSVGWGAEVAEVEGATGVEGPAPAAAALHLDNRSASFFFLTLLKPISTQRQQVNT